MALEPGETPNEVVLVTGISGSGKSVALHALEDAGFFCVDNLPPELLRDFLRLENKRLQRRVAIAVDVRSVGSLPHLLPLIEELRGESFLVRVIFLDASTDTLVRRFSESRRPHPLSQQSHSQDLRKIVPARRVFEDSTGVQREDPTTLGLFCVSPNSNSLTSPDTTLGDAIELERQLLSELREVSTVIDTSQLRPAQLRLWIRELVQAGNIGFTLVFESFAFKHGVPLDADFVFDVRVLPNPYYVRELRTLTGRDAAVQTYLQTQPEVLDMLSQIQTFVERWLPAFKNDQRSYLTVAIGCTGGQHRSVYLAQMLADYFSMHNPALIRHRELDARDSTSH
jgi:RNase adapter protein RapZ